MADRLDELMSVPVEDSVEFQTIQRALDRGGLPAGYVNWRAVAQALVAIAKRESGRASELVLLVAEIRAGRA